MQSPFDSEPLGRSAWSEMSGSRRRDGLREAEKADNQSFMKGKTSQNTEYEGYYARDYGRAQRSMDPEPGGLQGWKKLDVVDGRRSEIILGLVHELEFAPRLH